MKKTFSTRPLTTLARSLAEIIGAEAPALSDERNVPEINNLVAEKTANGKVDRILIYNPDALGEWFYEKYTPYYAPVEKYCSLTVPFLTANPPKTPVCFGTMFTGAAPSVHGINRYEKKLITIDSLFDSWARSGLKVALCSVENQSIPLIFAGRNIDYYLYKNDELVVKKALELIKEDRYDVIEVYNQNYDTIMHVTHPRSALALRAARTHMSSFDRLATAVEENWGAHDTFIAFSPDHGTHRTLGGFGHGDHGKFIPEDMNILHFYGVISKKK